MTERALAVLPDVGSVVLSDYAKGVLTPHVIRTVIDAACRLGKPVLVDPKGKDFSVYRNATLITPNRHELAEATRLPAVTDAEVVGRRQRAQSHRGKPRRAGDAQRGRHDARAGGGTAGPRGRLSGQGPRRIRRRRHCRGDACRHAGDRRRARGRHAGRQRRGCGRRRQARHRHRIGAGAALAAPAGGFARRRG